jgi:hypothetical protein
VGDYTDSKGGPGNVFLDGSEPDSAGGWSRVAPLITPEQVRRKHLFGVDLVSGTMNSITEKRDVLTLDDIADKIDDAVATVELETGVVILPTQITEKIPFDLHLYRSWGYTPSQEAARCVGRGLRCSVGERHDHLHDPTRLGGHRATTSRSTKLDPVDYRSAETGLADSDQRCCERRRANVARSSDVGPQLLAGKVYSRLPVWAGAEGPE